MADDSNQVRRGVDRVALSPEKAAVEIAARAIQLAGERKRRIVAGIAGGPGSGKSRIAADVIGILNKQVDGSAARVPMDGFLMPDERVAQLGLAGQLGAPETFEAAAFADFLENLRGTRKDTRAPTYSRKTGKVIADAFMIAGNVPILVVEGNYLLLPDTPWDRLRPMLDLAIFLSVPRELVAARLNERHAGGMSFVNSDDPDYVERVELVQYDRVAVSAGQADLIIEIVSES